MRIISASDNSEIIYLFLDVRLLRASNNLTSQWLASQTVEWADWGRFLGGHINYSVFLFLCIGFFMQNYFIQVIWNLKNDKYIHSITFYVELCTEYVGIGVNAALLKYNKYGNTHFFLFS